MGPHRFLTDSLDPLPVARHASAKMYADDECERFDWDEYGKKMHELAREATSAGLLGEYICMLQLCSCFLRRKDTELVLLVP